jgi:hypothetical protein
MKKRESKKPVTREVEIECQVFGEWALRRDVYDAMIDAIDNGLDDEWIESIVAECASHILRLRAKLAEDKAKNHIGTELTCADAVHAQVWQQQYRTLQHMLRDAWNDKSYPPPEGVVVLDLT